MTLFADSKLLSRGIANFTAIPVQADFAAPTLELQSLDGSRVKLSDLGGRLVLVNLWATWCPPCRAEMPILEAFYEAYRSQGLEVIGINQEEARDVVVPFIQDYALSFRIWLDPNYMAQREFHTAGLPSSYVIDRSGIVRLVWLGAISNENIERYVEPLLAK